MFTALQLADELKAIGEAEVAVGNPFAVDGMAPLGATDAAAITFSIPQNVNALTAGVTGDVPHEATVTPGAPILRIPLVLGDPDLYALISPWGQKGFGHSRRKRVTEMSLILIPQMEMTDTDPPTLGYDGTTWTPAAPEHMLTIWRGFFTFGDLTYNPADGGKTTVEATFHAMWAKSVNVPEGQKIATIGNPVAQGVTAFRL